MVDRKDAWKAIREIAGLGVSVVLLSVGPALLLALWEGEEYEVAPPTIHEVNALGSGDSLLAGVLSGLKWGPAEALRWGVACGAANAAVWDPGGFQRADVETLLPSVEIKRLLAHH